jgi:hypothetical protein
VLIVPCLGADFTLPRCLVHPASVLISPCLGADFTLSWC